MPKVVIF